MGRGVDGVAVSLESRRDVTRCGRLEVLAAHPRVDQHVDGVRQHGRITERVYGRSGGPLGYPVTRLPVATFLNTGHLEELSRLNVQLVVDPCEPLLQFVGRDHTRGEFISEALDDNPTISQAITPKVKSFMA